jgi:hypothetical protein
MSAFNLCELTLLFSIEAKLVPVNRKAIVTKTVAGLGLKRKINASNEARKQAGSRRKIGAEKKWPARTPTANEAATWASG